MPPLAALTAADLLRWNRALGTDELGTIALLRASWSGSRLWNWASSQDPAEVWW
ncbi:hypothetical protein SAMN05444920_101547 [Nonomuraea solani]|uniref:Uncharacterized protein n=1 Tax=Nonomuraea solani TaxID=1144553 RepID=A0A1H5UJ04_9ACTN|nr:hypothetical protein [Nonomuraea solani]SEF75002.1 hypothetical protein SAMN05444920_101547 [Nonomuraea solani]